MGNITIGRNLISEISFGSRRILEMTYENIEIYPGTPVPPIPPAPTLIIVALTQYPTKLNYLQDETLDLSGVTLTATYSDGTTVDVTNDAVFSPANGVQLPNVGQQTVAWQYSEQGGAQFSGSFSVTVTADIRSKLVFNISADSTEAQLYFDADTAETLTVDWGDGTAAVHPSGTGMVPKFISTHTYAVQGTYEVKIEYEEGHEWTLYGDNFGAIRPQTSLTSAKIGGGITTLYQSFRTCTSLTSVVLPEGLTTLSTGVFDGCTALTSLTIPSTVTSVGGIALRCANMTDLTVLAITPPTLIARSLTGLAATCAIYVPAESVEAYKAAAYWSTRAAYIQAIP